MRRRRCVVCGLRVGRGEWRPVKVWVPYRWRVAHLRCVVPSDAAIRDLLAK